MSIKDFYNRHKKLINIIFIIILIILIIIGLIIIVIFIIGTYIILNKIYQRYKFFKWANMNEEIMNDEKNDYATLDEKMKYLIEYFNRINNNYYFHNYQTLKEYNYPPNMEKLKKIVDDLNFYFKIYKNIKMRSSDLKNSSPMKYNTFDAKYGKNFVNFIEILNMLEKIFRDEEKKSDINNFITEIKKPLIPDYTFI